MAFWDELNREEQRVMIAALEDGWLNEIIGDYLGRSERNGAIWISSNDVDAIRGFIPRFTSVVKDMVERDLIEIREPEDGVWDHASSLTGAGLERILADPKTWLWSGDDDNRMVRLLTTDRADELMQRFTKPEQSGDGAAKSEQ